MRTRTSRCDRIITLIDKCLAEYEAGAVKDPTVANVTGTGWPRPASEGAMERGQER